MTVAYEDNMIQTNIYETFGRQAVNNKVKFDSR